MLRGFFGNLIFAIIARMLCGNRLNNTHTVVAMDTLLAPVSFCQKPNILIFNRGTEGPAWNRHGFPYYLNSRH